MRARLTKDFTFEAAQILPKAPEDHKCRRMHGHSFKIEVSVEGNVDPKVGWVYDHAKISEAMKPLLPANAKDYNQALTAAARDGHLSMTKWLLENGVTDPNAPDGFNKTALAYAIEKKFPEVEAELRSHGVHEKTRGP